MGNKIFHCLEKLSSVGREFKSFSSGSHPAHMHRGKQMLAYTSSRWLNTLFSEIFCDLSKLLEMCLSLSYQIL